MLLTVPALSHGAGYYLTGGGSLQRDKCSRCHSPYRPFHFIKTPALWKTTVNRMRRLEGAPIDDEEQARITRYLVATAALKDGWYHTGDMGYFDDTQSIYLVDRKKDMIITGDENVFSSDVEAVLYQHPNVHEAAVIGIPDERYGEALMAVIVPVPGTTISEEAMIAHCRGKIGGYKIPRRFAFLDEMPKSALGKILKTELRRVYASGTEEVK